MNENKQKSAYREFFGVLIFSIIMRIHQYGCEYEPKRLDKSIAV